MSAGVSQKRLLDATQGFAGQKVLIIGDLMLDHYLVGDVRRISPEGPIPVVRVESERRLLGGAGNVAGNILALGGEPFILSASGDDDPGRALTALLDDEGVGSFVVRDASRPTTIKTRVLAQNQQVVRIDRESNIPVRGEAEKALANALKKLLPGFGCVIVSDYAKGVVTKGLMQALNAAASTAPVRPFIMVDPKPVNFSLYAGVDLLTPNAKEAGEMAGRGIRDRHDAVKAGLAIFKKLKCKKLLITLGQEGIALFEGPGDVRRIPTTAQKVFDVTGAGDTVIAALAMGLLSGLDLVESAVLANFSAGIVVGQVGAATVSGDALQKAVAAQEAPPIESWLKPAQ